MSNKIIKELVGKVVTEENLVIGHRICANQGWNYGMQGDGCLGTIVGILKGEEFGLDYDFATVNWDDGATYNYPLNGEDSLKYSNEKVVKSEFLKLKEKVALYDIFTITKMDDDLFSDVKGSTAQIYEIGDKFISIYFIDGNGDYDEYAINNSNAHKIKLRKKHNQDNVALELLKSIAEEIETPKATKEVIVNNVIKYFGGNVKGFLREFYRRGCHKQASKEKALGNVGLNCEGSLYIETIFGKVRLICDSPFKFYIQLDGIREFIRSNVSPEIRKTYKKWIEIFNEFSDKTVFVESVKKVVLQSNCNKGLKKYFEENPIKLDEQFIDFNRGSKKISFTPKGKVVSIDDRGRLSGIRQEMSPHKFFGKYFKDVKGVSEYDIKCFADEIISTYGEYKISELEVGKIGQFYNELRQDGWTVGSCMRQKPVNYFEIYDKNPQVFRMMLIHLNGELVGRCLKVVSKDLKTNEEFVFFDRLYYKNEEVVAWFNSYCDNNNLTRKNKNSVDSNRTFYNKEEGGIFNKNVYVEILPTSVANKDIEHVYEKMPYLDTLRWGGLGILFNSGGEKTVKGRFEKVKTRYEFSRDGGIFHGQNDYVAYCHYNSCWTDLPCVLVTDGEYFKGLTVLSTLCIKTKNGFKFNR